MGPVYITLTLHHRQRMLSQRHRQWRLRNTRTITHFRYKQIVPRQQGLLQRTRWNDIVLEEELVDEIHGHQGEDQRIDPRHHELHRSFWLFPPLPLDLLGDIDIKNKRYYEESPPTLDPIQEKQIKYQYDDKLRPLYLRIEFFLFYHFS